MKIRMGFVSNSSSSSFVMYIDRIAHERAMSQIEDSAVLDILRQIFKNCEYRTVLTVPCVLLTGGDYDGCNVIGKLQSDNFDSESDGGVYEYWDEVVKPAFDLYKKNLGPDKYIEHWTDL